MNRKKIILAGLAICIIALVLVLQRDDELSPQASLMLDTVDWQTHTDSYLYLLGIDAQVGAKPLEVGKEIVKEIRAIEATYDRAESFEDIPKLAERSQLKLPDYAAFCSLEEAGCATTLMTKSDVPLESDAMRTLRLRYLAFMSMGDFRSMNRPHILETFPSFSHLVKGNRLESLDAIELARSGSVAQAIQRLDKLIAQEIVYLRESDSLIARMIAIALLNESLEVLSLIVQQYHVEEEPIELLSAYQLSLNEVMNREFAFATSSLQLIFVGEPYSYLPEWMIRLVLKPNLTVNSVVPVYTNAKRMSELSMYDFARLDSEQRRVEIKKSWLRNPVGTQLNEVSRIDVRSYIARGFDMNAKISLLNSLLRGQEIMQARNPYYQEELPPVRSDGNRLCFEGPYEDPRYYRCLTILNTN